MANPYPIPSRKIFDLQEEEKEQMEKFGVDTTTAGGEKTAAPTGKCPQCGSKLEEGTATPKCPVHGTEPFEKQGG